MFYSYKVSKLRLSILNIDILADILFEIIAKIIGVYIKVRILQIFLLVNRPPKFFISVCINSFNHVL